MFYYNIYNLFLASQLELTGLNHLDTVPEHIDLQLTLGKTPPELSQPPLMENPCAKMAENELLFFHRALNVRIFAANGNTIIVDDDWRTDPETVSPYIQSSVIGSLLLMRGIIPIHASTVLTPKGAVLIIGGSGAGKSTLACAMMNKGFDILGDDIAPVTVRDGRAIVHPGPPCLKLWENALRLNGMVRDNNRPIRSSLNKFYLDISGDHPRSDSPINRLCLLTTHNVPELKIRSVPREQSRLYAIRQHTYRSTFVRGLSRDASHFKVCMSLATLPMTLIKRPSNPDDFSEYADRIKEVILQ